MSDEFQQTRTDPKMPTKQSLAQAEDWLKTNSDHAFSAEMRVSLARLLDKTWEEGLECGELQARIMMKLRRS